MDCTKQMHVVLCLIWLASATTLALGQGTRVGFYSSSCPNAETIIQSTVKSHFLSDPTIAPALLRLHFHDCFVRGCDASVLIDGPVAEKTAFLNLQLRGFEVIEDVKKRLEAACPQIVSCADVLALAARDSVVLTTGQTWPVPTGRRDGRVSEASDASNLPSVTDSIDVQKQKFAAKGLDAQDLVTLVGGGHTIGTSSCKFFRYRLYNFSSTGAADPAIDPAFLPQLQSLCPENGNASKRVGLDNSSADKFDTSFFTNLRNGRGILESDQMLWTDASTKPFVQRFLAGGLQALNFNVGKSVVKKCNFEGQALNFNVEFGKSMVKMSNIEVKTGTDGEIRQVLKLRQSLVS